MFLQMLAGEHLVPHEMPALVVAALAQLQRRPGALAAARRRQLGGRRVVPAGRERPAQRRHAPRPDLMRPAVGQMLQRRRKRLRRRWSRRR